VAGTCEYDKKKRTFGFHTTRGISWLAAKTGQLLKKDSAPWSKCTNRELNCEGPGRTLRQRLVQFVRDKRIRLRQVTKPICNVTATNPFPKM
jgi:hypothetical protein